MKCSKCGNGNEEGFAFCAGCSASLENADNTVPIEDVSVNVIGDAVGAVEMSTHIKKKPKLPLLIAAVVLLLIGATAATFFAVNAKNTKEYNWLIDRGEKYLQQLEYEEAVAVFINAIDVQPKREEAYVGAATGYIGLNELDRAKDIIEQGLNIISEPGDKYLDLCEKLGVAYKGQETHVETEFYEPTADITMQTTQTILSSSTSELTDSITTTKKQINTQVSTSKPSKKGTISENERSIYQKVLRKYIDTHGIFDVGLDNYRGVVAADLFDWDLDGNYELIIAYGTPDEDNGYYLISVDIFTARNNKEYKILETQLGHTMGNGGVNHFMGLSLQGNRFILKTNHFDFGYGSDYYYDNSTYYTYNGTTVTKTHLSGSFVMPNDDRPLPVVYSIDEYTAFKINNKTVSAKSFEATRNKLNTDMLYIDLCEYIYSVPPKPKGALVLMSFLSDENKSYIPYYFFGEYTDKEISSYYSQVMYGKDRTIHIS